MAKLNQNSLLTALQGSVGDLVIVHSNGKAWSRAKPSVKPKSTPRRKAHQHKLTTAARWTTVLLKQAPEVVARYTEAAEGTPWSWQNLAIADYMHGPVIDDIDLSGYTGHRGEPIRVQARDNVRPPMKLGVAEVRVLIRAASGEIVERGVAARDGDSWVYVTKEEVTPAQIVQVEVTAVDQPNRHATKTLPHLTRA